MVVQRARWAPSGLGQWRWFGRVGRAGPLYVGAVGAALAYIAAFGGTGALRAIYPYPIDGIEPGSLDTIDRILTGHAIYAPASLDYVPMIYGPLYFYASAAVA